MPLRQTVIATPLIMPPKMDSRSISSVKYKGGRRSTKILERKMDRQDSSVKLRPINRIPIKRGNAVQRYVDEGIGNLNSREFVHALLNQQGKSCESPGIRPAW